jgi:hypothetical protein
MIAAAETVGLQQPPGGAMLRENLVQVLQLPKPAVDWLCSLYEVIQIFDDYADGDEVPRERLNALIWDALVAMPGNSFFVANAPALLPVLAVQILKWQGADAREREGQPSEMAFAWRAGYYDVVLAAVAACHGADVAHHAAPLVLQLYGERYADYMKEFDHA